MSNTIALAFLLIAGSTVPDVHAKMSLDQVANMMKPMAKKCISQGGLAQATFDEINKSGVVPNDDTVACYYACLFKAMKVMSKDGKILVDAIVKQVDMLVVEDVALLVKDAILSCHDLVKDTSDEPCELTRFWAKCYYEKNPNLRFLP